MAKSTNRVFHMTGTSKKTVVSGRLWYPAADVYQANDGWVVKVELAGVSDQEIEIKIQGDTLHIAGCRKDRSCEHGGSYHQMEITYSSFEKSLRFPTNIDGASIEHAFEDGLLIIHIRKGK